MSFPPASDPSLESPEILHLTESLLDSFRRPLAQVEIRLAELQAQQLLLLSQISQHQETLKDLPNMADFTTVVQKMPQYQSKVVKVRAGMTRLTKQLHNLSTRTEALRVKREQLELERAAEREIKLARERELIAAEPSLR